MPVNKITPQVGATGIFVIAEPYSDFIPGTSEDAQSSAKKYTCIAVRRFSDILGEKSNIKEVFYDEFIVDFTDEEFAEQVDNNVSIVTLVDENGNLFYVPDSYILGVPITLGYPYADSYLVIQLKSHFLEMDLDPISTEISQLVRDRVGLTADVEIVTPETISYVTEAQHNSVESTRISRVTNSKSLIEQVSEKTTEITRQKQEIDLIYADNDRLKQLLQDNNIDYS